MPASLRRHAASVPPARGTNLELGGPMSNITNSRRLALTIGCSALALAAACGAHAGNLINGDSLLVTMTTYEDVGQVAGLVADVTAIPGGTAVSNGTRFGTTPRSTDSSASPPRSRFRTSARRTALSSRAKPSIRARSSPASARSRSSGSASRRRLAARSRPSWAMRPAARVIRPPPPACSTCRMPTTPPMSTRPT